MKERPILFSGPMVRALLAGTKTQTRRIIKDQSIGERFSHMTDDGLAHLEWLGDPCCGSGVWDVPEYSANVAAPYGKTGDRLWVRESHWWFKDECDHETGYYPPALTADDVEYRADGESTRHGWRPSIHMPRWASRILLEITSVRIERLQDISQADAQAEGAPPGHPSIDQISREFGYPDFPRSWYAQLWEEINGPGAWAQNPWVWVVEFKRVQQASSGRPSQLEDAPCSA
jgi:hypothetical protein